MECHKTIIDPWLILLMVKSSSASALGLVGGSKALAGADAAELFSRLALDHHRSIELFLSFGLDLGID
jgi:hypothetical protein